MEGRTVVCYSCGREPEHVTGRLPCEELSGWLMVSHWKGRESVEHYSFCSAECLYQWSKSRIVEVPDVFLKSFDDQEWGKVE